MGGIIENMVSYKLRKETREEKKVIQDEARDTGRQNDTKHWEGQIKFLEDSIKSRERWLSVVINLGKKYPGLNVTDEVEQIREGIKKTEQKIVAKKAEFELIKKGYGWNN